MARSDSEDVRYILPIPTETVTDDQLFGRRKTFAGLQVVEWAFLISSITNIAVCSGMTLYSLIKVVKQDSHSADFTLTVLVLINCVFCIIYALNGELREKEYEIYIFIGAILFILMYVVIDYGINKGSHTDVKLGRLVVTVVLAPVNIVLAILVAKEFGWLEFKIVGASETLQFMYRDAARYTSLLKFDLQITVNLVLLVLQNGIEVSKLDKVTIGVGLPVSVCWALLGWFSLRRELRWGMIVFGIIGLMLPVYTSYVIYKIYDIFATMPGPKGPGLVLLYGTMAAAGLALLVRGILFIEAWKVFRNFGKGLRERAFEVEANERTSLLAVPRRR